MVDEFKELLLRRPFKPFRFTTDGGRRFDVTRPFQVAVGLTRFTYVSPDAQQRTELQLRDLTSIQPLNDTNARTGDKQ